MKNQSRSILAAYERSRKPVNFGSILPADKVKLDSAEERSSLVAALALSRDAVVITDAKGYIRYVNPSLERLTGYSKEEVLGRSIHILDSGRHNEAFYKGLREALARDGVWRGRLTSRRKDGTLFDVECNHLIVKNPAGTIVSHVSMLRDLMERMKLEAIVEEVDNEKNSCYIFSSVRPELTQAVHSLHALLSVVRAKLGTCDVVALKECLDTAGDQISKIASLLRSIEGWTQCEKPALQNVKLPDFLEKLAALAREEFVSEDADNEKKTGYIFSGVRHEIGTVVNSLSAVLGEVKATQGTLKTPAIGTSLDLAMDHASKLISLLRNMEHCTRYEQQSHVQKVDLPVLLKNTVGLVKEDFVSKGIEIKTHGDPDAVLCYADPRSLQRVLLNLLVNAADALEGRKHPSVFISLLRTGEKIRIRVEDNGCGIPEEQQEDIFKPFYTTKPGGAGLGLVIVKKLLTAMNCSVTVARRKEAGTIMDIFIPMAKPATGNVLKTKSSSTDKTPFTAPPLGREGGPRNQGGWLAA